MNIANPPDSVLTHGGDSESAITSTLKTHTETLQAQHDKVMLSGTVGVIPERHMHYETPVLVADPVKDLNYPKTLHSVNNPNQTYSVLDSNQEQEYLNNGWSLTPMERRRNDKGEIEYIPSVPPVTQQELILNPVAEVPPAEV